MKRGFTIAELLIVIGIIAVLLVFLLGSLTTVKQGARDDQRVADLHQVQQALQLFYLKCGFYPGHYDPLSTDSSRCLGGTNADLSLSDNNPATWQDLQSFLAQAELGFSNIPNDPIPGKNYSYWVQIGSVGIARAQCYVLGADFETKTKSLSSDLDNTDIIDRLKPVPPTCDDLDCKGFFPAVIDCDDASGHYCIGTAECFAK